MSLSDYIYQEPMNTNDAIRFVESWARKTMRLSTADIREGVLALIAERDQLKADLALATAREVVRVKALAEISAIPCEACWADAAARDALLADPRPEAERLLRIEAAARGLRDVAKRANSEPPGTDESFALLRAGIDAEAALYAALAEPEEAR